MYVWAHGTYSYMYRQHQEDDKEKTHLILTLDKCSSSQGIGVGDDLPSFSVSNLSAKLSGNFLIIPSG